MLTYSTCSLNPIENESVVYHILQKYGDSLELVDCSSLLGGFFSLYPLDFKVRDGVTHWKVLDDAERIPDNKGTEGFFVEYKTYEEVPESRQKYVKDTMFCHETEEAMLTQYKINRCVRVFPHDQDTSALSTSNIRWFLHCSFQKA